MEKFITEHPGIFRFFVTFKLVSNIVGTVLAVIVFFILLFFVIPSVTREMKQADERAEAFDAYYASVQAEQTQADAEFDANMEHVQQFFSEASRRREAVESSSADFGSDFDERYAAAYEKVFGKLDKAE